MRYAIYFAPAGDSRLWHFGCSVIGYDAMAGEGVPQFHPADFTAVEWRKLTEEPARYGFHATLKAPFRLAERMNQNALEDAACEIARGQIPFDLELKVTDLDGFIALTPVEAPPALSKLEHRLVEAFEAFRAPLNDAEIARRLLAPLTPRQRTYLDRYGYPYVHEEFRFHMTLSSRIANPAWRSAAVASLAREFASRCRPAVVVDRLAVFREENGRFRIVASFPFG